MKKKKEEKLVSRINSDEKEQWSWLTLDSYKNFRDQYCLWMKDIMHKYWQWSTWTLFEINKSPIFGDSYCIYHYFMELRILLSKFQDKIFRYFCENRWWRKNQYWPGLYWTIQTGSILILTSSAVIQCPNELNRHI